MPWATMLWYPTVMLSHSPSLSRTWSVMMLCWGKEGRKWYESLLGWFYVCTSMLLHHHCKLGSNWNI